MFIIAVPWPDLSTGSPPGVPKGPPGLKLLASKNDVRAWPGGFGYAKVGANYGMRIISNCYLSMLTASRACLCCPYGRSQAGL